LAIRVPRKNQRRRNRVKNIFKKYEWYRDHYRRILRTCMIVYLVLMAGILAESVWMKLSGGVEVGSVESSSLVAVLVIFMLGLIIDATIISVISYVDKYEKRLAGGK
jgi:sterol desaturase/sphingolipid hydroxylase (fatty acid hydroxylase superfamily)